MPARRTELGSWSIVLALVLGPLAALAEPDEQGCKDHPLVSRMPGFHIYRCEASDFEALPVRDGKREFKVEGSYTYVGYNLDAGKPVPSRVQLIRNYENALKPLGGAVVYQDDDGLVFLRVAKGGRETWIELGAFNPEFYTLKILEKAAMEQEVVANADAFAKGIRATGHAAVYGLYFDTGKAELKPASDATLAEVAKLLTADPALKLLVVGHTDSVGVLEANVKLSLARADAVVKALVAKHGIAAARLKAQGAGPMAPVASNRAEEGRALNRRVELVEQ